MKVALFLFFAIVATISVQAAPGHHLVYKVCPTEACDGKETFFPRNGVTLNPRIFQILK